MNGINASLADGTERLAAFAASIKYEDLPLAVVTTLKDILLDTLGTTLAANTLGPGCQELLAVGRSAGGNPESTLIGYGDRVPALVAALVNGGMSHALNYDAGGPTGHLGLLVPAPLAVAERVGGVNGKDFLAALAAGLEVSSRLTVAMKSGGGKVRGMALDGQVLGYFGAAVSAGRILGLDSRQMHSALGLSLMQSAGTMQIVLDGDPPAKAIYGAFCNQGGLLSALLAKEGLRAECNALGGPAGLFALFYDGKYDPSPISRDLGSDYLVPQVSFKPWPTSGHVHPFIEAALELRKQHELHAEDIKHVELHGSPQVRAWFEPVEERKRPLNAANAGNSIFFGAAKALNNGQVILKDFTPEGLQDPSTMELAQRMSYVIDSGLDRAGIVVVTTVSGQTWDYKVDSPLGDPRRPMSHDQLVNKFRECASYAAVTVPGPKLDEIISAVERLEQLEDAGGLAAMMSSR